MRGALTAIVAGFCATGCSQTRVAAIRTATYVERSNGKLQIFVREDIVGPDARKIGLYDGTQFIDYAFVAEIGCDGKAYVLRESNGTQETLVPEDNRLHLYSFYMGGGEPDAGLCMDIVRKSSPDNRVYLAVRTYGEHEQEVRYWLPPPEQLSALGERPEPVMPPLWPGIERYMRKE